MSNISLKGQIKLSAIPKDKITSWTDKNGVTHKVLEIEIMSKKEPKQGFNGRVYTHYIKVRQTKEEKDAKATPTYLGDLETIDFTPKQQGQQPAQTVQQRAEEVRNKAVNNVTPADDLPF